MSDYYFPFLYYYYGAVLGAVLGGKGYPVIYAVIANSRKI